MALRQIEVVVPKDGIEITKKLVELKSVTHFWEDSSELQEGYLVKVLIDASDTEEFLDKAEDMFGGLEYYRLVMLPVEATLPRINDEEKDEPDESGNGESEENDSAEPWEKPLSGARVSREELYTDIRDGIGMSGVYLAMVALSTIVASLGVMRDSTAVVIGAMVIAPLLAPNVGMALATVLADKELGLKALQTNFLGLAVALVLSVMLGLLLTVDSSVQEISMRTEVALSDIALALASGAAGVLAYTLGMSAAVIGVMVAVALLPPLVTAGLLLGNGQFELAFYAFILVLTNVICVNLAAVATFIMQGIRPRTWYESAKAKRANIIAITLWVALLLALAVIIYYIS
ncbi:MAG: TIGR00341 family protein [Cyclonatronaceae bacterium]